MAPLDDYYNYRGQYLGSDGASSNNMRLISNENYSRIRQENGGTTSESATAALQQAGREITVNIPGATSEGAYFKALYDKGNGVTEAEIKEQSTMLLLDTKNATLTVHTNSDKGNDAFSSKDDSPNTIAGVKDGTTIVLGQAHTHQIADLEAPNSQDIKRTAQYQSRYGDGQYAKIHNRTVYSIDSHSVDKQVPVPSIMRPGSLDVKGIDNIFSTQDLYNNNKSILRNALETYGKKP